MRTDLQIQASRINGSKSNGPVTPEGKVISAANSAQSTGPTTPEGKARVAQNAVRYAAIAEAILLKAEDSQEFKDLLASLTEELKPEPGIETRIVEVIAAADWRRMRLWCIEKEQLAHETVRQDLDGCSADREPAKCTAMAYGNLSDRSRALEMINRHEARFDRQYFRSLALLESRREKKMKNVKTK